VLPELERGTTDLAGLSRLAELLKAGPWCWPPPASREALDLAFRATGQTSPPATRVGTGVGVTVHESSGCLWLIDVNGNTGTAEADLGDTTRRSWGSAVRALPRSVPYLWSPVNLFHAQLPSIKRLGTHLKAGVAANCKLVTGPSFGLAFILALASKVFRFPLPGDLIATAGIEEDGSVSEVDGLSIKIAAVVELMPQVKRLLVASTQEAEALALANGQLQVVGIQSASHALELAFGERLAELLVQQGTDLATRHQLSEWFFRFCLVGSAELIDWSPIAAAAAHALSEWPGLNADDRFMLGFAKGIAERHERNGGTLPVPSAEWLLARPAPLRTHLVAHLVQQTADTGQPTWRDLEPLVSHVRASSLEDAQLMQLKVEGALARLSAVTGRPSEALRRQEELAHIFVDCMLYEEVSFPLSEWFRLAGALGDQAAAERADKVRRLVEAVGGLGEVGGLFVELSRAVAMCRLASSVDRSGLDFLSTTISRQDVPEHLKWAAARILLNPELTSPDDQVRSKARCALEWAATHSDQRRGHSAAVNLALVQLERALRTESVKDSESALGRLAELEPGIVAHLSGAAPNGGVGRYVALFFPY
jgi:hypothetical protein